MSGPEWWSPRESEIGRLLLAAIYTRDFMILQGVVLFVAAGFVIVNFLVDMLYAVLDPRIRHAPK